MEDYDAGILNDYGGGNVQWWQDYIRAEVARANHHWREQTNNETIQEELENELRMEEYDK